MSAVFIEDAKLITPPRNTLRAYIPSGMIISDITIHVSGGSAWASPPALRMADRSGAPILDTNGRQRWKPIVSFTSKSVRDTWSKAVLLAVHDQYPDVLADVHAEAEA